MRPATGQGSSPRGAAGNPLVAVRRKERDRGGFPHPPFASFSPRDVRRTVRSTIRSSSQPIPTFPTLCFAASAASCRESPSVLSVTLRRFPPDPFPSGPREGVCWGVVGRVEVSGASRCADAELGFACRVRESPFSRSFLFITFVIFSPNSRFVDWDREILSITRDSFQFFF